MKLPGIKNTAVVSLAGVVTLGMFLVQPAQAFWPVIDPTAIVQAIKQLSQLKQAYAIAKQEYAQAKYMATRISHPMRESWRTAGMRYLDQVTQNQGGETTMWDSMANGNPGIANQAWKSATYGFSPRLDFSGEVPGSSKRLASVATAEIIDSSAIKCESDISQYRINMQRNKTPESSLQSVLMDDTDTTNSHIDQMNLQNIQAANAADEARSQGAIQGCLAEQQVLANKMTRDATVASLNYAADTRIALTAHPLQASNVYGTQIP